MRGRVREVSVPVLLLLLLLLLPLLRLLPPLLLLPLPPPLLVARARPSKTRGKTRGETGARNVRSRVLRVPRRRRRVRHAERAVYDIVEGLVVVRTDALFGVGTPAFGFDPNGSSARSGGARSARGHHRQP